MAKAISIIITLLVYSNSFAQSSWESEELFGSVKRYRTENFYVAKVKGKLTKVDTATCSSELNVISTVFNNSGHRVSYYKAIPFGIQLANNIYELDSANRLIVKTERDLNLRPTRIYLYNYNDSGDQTELIETTPTMDTVMKIIFQYDTSRNLIRESGIHYLPYDNPDWNFTKIYTPDEKGNVVSFSFYNSSGNREYGSEMKYDDLNQLTEIYNFKKGEARTFQSFLLDDNGWVFIDNYYDYLDDYYSAKKNKYNRKGWIVESIIKTGIRESGDEPDVEIYTYKYKFDKVGNWIRVVRSVNGVPVELTERTLVYY